MQRNYFYIKKTSVWITVLLLIMMGLIPRVSSVVTIAGQKKPMRDDD